MNINEIIIPQEKLLEELGYFKEWSGHYLVRVLADIKKYGGYPVLLGSGGLLKYKDRFFVVTNAHLFRNDDIVDLKSEIVIPYTIENEKTFKMTIITAFKDTQLDIAVFEIEIKDNTLKGDHRFLEYDYIEHDLPSYVEKTNIVFLQGYPSQSTLIDHDKKEIIAETFPYCTFVNNFDEEVNSLYLFTESGGIDENGNKVELGHFGGMSGSFVYGYYMNEIIPYKCLGVLTEWNTVENLLEVYPMDEFIEFIDEKFF